MAKQRLTRGDLETLIVADVRRRARCEGFKSISLYSIIDYSALGIFNWAPSVINYGEAGKKSSDDALREIIPRLQSQYDLADD